MKKSIRKSSKRGEIILSPNLPITGDCVGDIRAIIEKARKGVVRHVNSTMTLAYWLIGRRIVVEEQGGKDRAEYGWHLMERISRELTDVYCRGFGVANLRNFREFYLQNPSEKAIRYALRSELGWTHHRAIIRVADSKRETDQPTIGILLGTEIREEDVRYSVLADCERLFATKLMPYLPSKGELLDEIERSRGRTAMRKSAVKTKEDK